MDEGTKIIKKTMWYINNPFWFKLNYFFTEKRKLANWEVYVIILMIALIFLLIGYILGSGKIPFS